MQLFFVAVGEVLVLNPESESRILHSKVFVEFQLFSQSLMDFPTSESKGAILLAQPVLYNGI